MTWQIKLLKLRTQQINKLMFADNARYYKFQDVPNKEKFELGIISNEIVKYITY